MVDDGSRHRRRPAATRDALLDAAERLFAEHGVAAVSDRRVAVEAGQGNNAAVAYHFGRRADLVEALVMRHLPTVERRCAAIIAGLPTDAPPRAWIGALVHPLVDHALELPRPTFHLRCAAQLRADPAHAETIARLRAEHAPSLRAAQEGLRASVAALSPTAERARGDMTRLVLLHGFASLELRLTDGRDDETAARAWRTAGAEVVDALAGLWTAPSHTAT
ncbi:TetR/AcrR family transcriptional regulator [Nocardioidaceae bacterium]|nr:TetR/AcrR family transcriptional regulator [Nocardioidaceae bacterium]